MATFDLGQDNFSDSSARIGGLELVEHFMWNVGKDGPCPPDFESGPVERNEPITERVQ